MKVCIIGAGSIGGLVAARLAKSDAKVSVVARGEHLRAIAANGLRLTSAEAPEIVAPVDAYGAIGDVPPQDLIVLAVKAHQLTPIVDEIAQLATKGGLFLTMQNGIPWWYFHKFGAAYEGQVLESVDPGGRIAASLPIDCVLGSVVYPAAEITAPGVIHLVEGNRFSLGELDGQRTDRVEAVSQLFTQAGFKAPVASDLRGEIWTKLWGNMSFNPISALTGATLAGICTHPAARGLAASMMKEAQAVGEALGVRFRIPLEKRIAGAEAVGEHKTSMLQDVEAGRTTELEALVGSIIELGRITGIPTPSIDAVYACARLREDTPRG